MEIEIWSDFVCPFCYIGKRRFEAALAQFPHQESVRVTYRSFELDPNLPRDGNPGVYDMLVAKYGMSHEQAVANTKQIAEQAKSVGLEFRFEDTIQTNTFDAHRLAHFAASKGKLEPMTERLFKAHFTDALHLGEHETLADLAAEAGLDREEALRMLADGSFANEVRADEQQAKRLGVRGVPFFVIHGKYGISGAQPSETFLAALERAWGESKSLTMLDDSKDDVTCEDGGCAIPTDKERSKSSS